MNTDIFLSDDSDQTALELYRPAAGHLFDLELAAELAGVSRRALLIYCRAGVVQPIIQMPFGALAFDEAAVRDVRRAEWLRMNCGVNVTGLRLVFEMERQLEVLRDELEFLRREEG